MSDSRTGSAALCCPSGVQKLDREVMDPTLISCVLSEVAVKVKIK